MQREAVGALRNSVPATPIVGSTNPKGRLNELCQKKGWKSPDYHLTSQGGPPHQPHFIVQVEVNGERFEPVKSGPSRRNAEHLAAEQALQKLQQG